MYTFLWRVVVFSLAAVVGASKENTEDNNNFGIDLQASWAQIPFKLNLLESVASRNESLYLQVLPKIIGFVDSNDSDEDREPDVDGGNEISDASIYDEVLRSLSLDSIQESFVNFNLVNKIYSPRVQAHFKYYNDVVMPKYQGKLTESCSVDSFGNEVDGVKDGKFPSWVQYNDKIYCSPDELYALQTDSKSLNEEILPFDRVIGANTEAPLLVLYGDINSDSFISMFENLYLSSKEGKLRFVWRYIPIQDLGPEYLGGYGVDLTLKRTDYLAVDDRNIKEIEAKSSKKTSNSKKLKLENDLSAIAQSNADLHPITKDQLKDLGSKLVTFIQSNSYKAIKKYDLLKIVLNDFPKYAYYISKLKNQKQFPFVNDVIEQNRKIGASEDSNGIYINGLSIPKEQFDLTTLVHQIESELKVSNELVEYGFTIPQTKKLITKFALLSAVKESQFKTGNSLMGDNENRFKLYEHEFVPNAKDKKGGVLFFNNIETESSYLLYSANRQEMYIGPGAYQMPHGQIPALKENVHDLIFVINFSHKEQLKVFFAMAKFFLDRGIPKQIGILPLIGSDPRDEKLAQLFYFLAEKGSAKESLALLYKYFETTNVDEENALFETINIPEDHIHSYAEFRDTLHKFSIDSPSVIFNGVINDLQGSTWQKDMKNQVAQDVRLLQHHIRQETDQGKKLKDILYENAKSERNLRVIPKDPANILYKRISNDMYKKSVGFKKDLENKELSGTFWLIGDFNDKKLIDQFIIILKVIAKSSSPNSMQIRVINTSQNNDLLDQLREKFSNKPLNKSNTKNLIDYIKDYKSGSLESLRSESVSKLLEENEFQLHQPSLIFNSRYFRLTEIFKAKELQTLIEYEFKQRLSIIKDLVEAYPEDFSYRTLFDFNRNSGSDNIDWFDLVLSSITKSFYVDDFLILLDDVARFDFSSLNMNNTIDVVDYDNKRPIDILLIIDPIEEYSQKLVNVIGSILDFPFVNIKILLQPNEKSDEDDSIKRFYRGVFPASRPQFDSEGNFDVKYQANFTNLPEDQLFTTDIDGPHKWIITSHDTAPENVDLDNIKLSNYESTQISGSYELKNILVEGYANDVRIAFPTTGLELELISTNDKTDTNVMATYGYFQLPADAGIWTLSIKSDSISSKHCSLLSASSNRYVANDTPLKSVQVPVFDLNGKTLSVRVTKNPGYENKNLLIELANGGLEHKDETKDSSWFGSLINSGKKEVKPKQADINVFSIASGHLYERLMGIMIASVRAHTNKLVKFWIIDNYISPQFKKLLPKLAQEYDVEYQLITYKWPVWLTKQREKQRTIWGYKILFLDVIFPQDLDKVIFVDADLIVRSDLSELVDFDLEGAPYGFTPMCDSREEMEGFRFWKLGYWTQVLQGGLNYHISALYVVDLNNFRALTAGDRLRNHYDRLASDPNSLSNLDQDLPNNMQKWIKIKSLPQEWLWCETWCSDQTFSSAKVVDLCNNPLTKENKLDRAKRQIPEWTSYDDQIHALQHPVSDSSDRPVSEHAHDEL